MRQSCGSLWNLIRISRKQARWAICLLPAFTITSLLQPSILFSFTQLYFSLISAIPHHSLLLSSCIFTSRIHFNGFPPVFFIQTDPTTDLAFYLFVWCSSKVVGCDWSPQVGENYCICVPTGCSCMVVLQLAARNSILSSEGPTHCWIASITVKCGSIPNVQ